MTPYQLDITKSISLNLMIAATGASFLLIFGLIAYFE